MEKYIQKQQKLQIIQQKASKIHRVLLYSIIIPVFLLIFGLLFSEEKIAAIGFWSMVIIFMLYILIINWYNYKINKIIKKMQNE